MILTPVAIVKNNVKTVIEGGDVKAVGRLQGVVRERMQVGGNPAIDATSGGRAPARFAVPRAPDVSATAPRARGREQALRPGAGARGRRLRGARRRGRRARRRQRRRASRRSSRRSPASTRTDEGKILFEGEPGQIASPSDAVGAGDRDRLPGPRAVRQPRRGGEPVPRPGGHRLGLGDGHAAARRDRDGASLPRAARAVRGHDPERALRGGRPVRRPAPAGRGRALAARRAEGRAARRAHGRARRRTDGAGARADQAAARARASASS